MQSKFDFIVIADLNVAIAIICSTSALHFEIFRGVFRTQASICDWAFIVKIKNR